MLFLLSALSQCANAQALFEDLNKWNTMTKMIVPENNNDIIWGGCHVSINITIRKQNKIECLVSHHSFL